MGQLYELAGALADCVVAELNATAAGAPERVCVYPGGDPADDDCCPGQVAVIVEGTFPTDNFPIVKAATNPCDLTEMGVNMLVRVTRCVTGGTRGEPPECSDLDAAARTVLDDMEATFKAARCCWFGLDEDEIQVIMDPQRTYGPLGGCVGHETRLRVGIARDCGCG